MDGLSDENSGELKFISLCEAWGFLADCVDFHGIARDRFFLLFLYHSTVKGQWCFVWELFSRDVDLHYIPTI
jgi:hypothetical protein